MKKTLYLFIALCFVLCNAKMEAQPFGGGNGTTTAPYQIHTLAHLNELADSSNTQGWA